MKSFKIIAIVLLITTTACAQKSQTKTKNQEKTDYSARSNIIKNPKKLTGDEKAIFYHPYFLRLSHEEAKNLDPFKMKEEFSKLGITTDQRGRFVKAYSFFDATLIYHKKSCEQWESFKDLAPQSKN
jgi:type III secretory pathway component EscV